MTAEAHRSQVVRRQLADTAAAASAFEARWTVQALRRVSPDIHRRLLGKDEQRDIFDRAVFDGDPDEIELQGAALCRGWRAAVKAMEAAAEPDDAYFVGMDPRTGCKVAVGPSRGSVERVQEIDGSSVTFLTPDEVATLYAATEGFKAIDAIKQRFPGAEIIDRRPSEPAKRDSGLEAA